MKRQHPDNPDFFWCQKCEAYKARDGFGKNKNNDDGLSTYCLSCNREYAALWKINNPEKVMKNRANDSLNNRKRCLIFRENNREHLKSYYKNYFTEHSEYRRESSKKLYWRDVDKSRQYNRDKQSNNIVNLTDAYIKSLLREQGHKTNEISAEAIELKRQQIIMKRTLKQFKKWREENESNHADVSGKQFPDEKDYEGRIQVG